MSGICGIFNWQNHDEQAHTHLNKMMTAIAHRGRDAHTRFSANRINLGHLQTAAFPESSGGANPTWYEDEIVCVALDGVIFNGKELFTGEQTEQGSAATVAVCFAQHPPQQFPKALDGPFALAVWDKQQQTLWLARDGFGSKPLYYCHLPDKGLTLFASEPKGILAHPAVVADLDEAALSTFLSFGLIPSPLSGFAHIYKVFPGEVVKIDKQGALCQRRFWHIPPYRPVFDDLEAWAPAVREKVIETFAKHIAAEKTFGVFLSGGLDSTLIVALLKILGISDIHTFTLDFDPSVKRGHPMEDLHWARQVAQIYGTKHQEFIIDGYHDPQKILPDIIKLFDEPTITPNAYSKYFLAKMAADKGLRSCLSGSGSEVNFERPLPKKWGKLQKMVPSGRTEDIVLHLRTRLFTPEMQQKLLQNPVDARQIGLEAVCQYVRSVRTDVPVERVSGTSFRMLIADKGIPVQDRLAAMHGIEIRYPLYDPQLLDFMSHVPNSYKGFGDATLWKAIMLKAFENDLPEGVLQREIIGYPSYYWTNGEVQAMQERLLSDAALEEVGLFKAEAVREFMADDAVSKRKSAGKKTWGLMMLQAWYQEYLA